MAAMNRGRGPAGQIGQPVRAPKTSELVADQLRRQIVRGVVRPGQKLPPETELMGQFGVSRPTIREAFRILETERLIVVRPGSRGGAQVVAPDLTVAARYVGLLLQFRGATIDDVYEARKVAEPACAALLASRRTEQDLADLAAVIGQLESAIEGRDGAVPDPALWSRLTQRFHELIMQRSGNQTLALQGAVLHDIVATHTELRVAGHFDQAESPERFRRAARSYRKLLKLIADGDADGARRLWHGHMDSAASYLLKDDLRDKPVVELFALLGPVGEVEHRLHQRVTGWQRRLLPARQHPQLAPGDPPPAVVLAQPVTKQHLGPVDQGGVVLHSPPDPPVAGAPYPLAVLADNVVGDLVHRPRAGVVERDEITQPRRHALEHGVRVVGPHVGGELLREQVPVAGVDGQGVPVLQPHGLDGHPAQVTGGHTASG
jgi:GntR family transcriptional regulator, transcriptional repressor for pyruvate dehydrogenase complex